MAKLLKLRRGTTSQHSSFTGAEGEVTVDTTKDTLVVHDGSTAGGIPLAKEAGNITGNAATATTAGTVTTAAQTNITSTGTLTGLTVSGDVHFDNGADAGKDILWDVSDDALEFSDNVKAVFGAGADLSIHHDGSNSFVKDTGTGNLQVWTNQLSLMKSDGNESMVQAIQDGSVELYEDGVKKLETTSGGINVHEDTDKVISFTGGIGEIGSVPGIQGSNTAGSALTSLGMRGTDLRFATGSAERLRITSGGNVSIPNDSGKFLAGTGEDLELYHNGTNSIIQNGTGHLYIRSDSVDLTNAAGSENYVVCTPNGSVKIYYDHSTKLETATNGINVTGRVHATGDSGYGLILEDSVKVGLGTAKDLELYHDGSNSFIENAIGNLYIQNDSSSSSEEILIRPKGGEQSGKFVPNGQVELYYDNSLKFNTEAAGAQVHGHLRVDDSNKFQCGNAQDLALYHNGSNSFIENATGNLYLYATAGNSINLGKSGEICVKAVPDGAVTLYYNDIRKFETDSLGAVVYGSEGEGAILYMYADEGDDNADKWKLLSAAAGGFFLENYTAGAWETNIKALGNGAVELYYDNAIRLETISLGVKAHGSLLSCVNTANAGDSQLYLEAGEGGTAYISFAADNSDDNNDQMRILCPNGDGLKIQNKGSGSWESNLHCDPNAGVKLYYDNTLRLETGDRGAKVSGYFKAFGNASDSEFDDNAYEHVLQSDDSGGYVLICEHTHDSDQTGIRVDYSDATPDDNGHPFFIGVDNSASRYKIYSSGDTWSSDGGTVNSDRSLKENIVDATSKIEDLKKLKVRNFNFKSEIHPVSNQKRIGFIAQEVEEVFPALVAEHDISRDKSNPTMKKGIKDAWAPILVKALQEAITKIETLETKVAALEAG